MAVTEIDPNTALVVVDLQKGLVGLPLLHPIEDIVAQTSALLGAFRARGLPIAFVTVNGSAPGRTEQPRRVDPRPDGWTDLIPQLERRTSEIAVIKRSWGAFATTDLEARLRARGVTQVVIAGVATGTGVESTARQAYELGFNVTLAIDAMTDVRAEAHDYSIRTVFPRLGEPGTSREIIALLPAVAA